jgi:PTS system ascorbate-specific IIA component
MYANLFFTLASDNPEKHLDNMQQLSVILSSEDLIAELMQVTNEEELLALAVRSGL